MTIKDHAISMARKIELAQQQYAPSVTTAGSIEFSERLILICQAGLEEAERRGLEKAADVDKIRRNMIILLDIIRSQGWGPTTEFNYEFFEEDIFPMLGIQCFGDISREADKARARTSSRESEAI